MTLSGELTNMNAVRLFFAGDFCSKPSTSGIKVSDELKELIASCDLKFVNFEVPLKPEGIRMPSQKRERYYQNDDAPAFLKGLGFNLFSLANNHAFDWGEGGFRKTKDSLGNLAFGAGTYDEAYKAKVVDINGIKVGFMAVCFAAYTGVFDDVTKQDGLGCAYINDLRVNHAIMEAKRTVDYLFILPHDGIEYIDVPLPETIARYRDFIDYGADGVIGTHPHCPQGWETYKGKPIFYSLGNFMFNSKEEYSHRVMNKPHWYEGLCVLMTIGDDGLNWKVLNTRNKDNVGIDLDEAYDRKVHNDQLCSYLRDKDAYWSLFREICESRGYSPFINIVDRTMHRVNIKQYTKAVIKYWGNRLLGRKSVLSDDFSLERMIRHDSNRQLVLRSLWFHQQDGCSADNHGSVD